MVFPRAEFNLKSENGADEGDAPSENPGSHNPSPEIPRMCHILPFIKHSYLHRSISVSDHESVLLPSVEELCGQEILLPAASCFSQASVHRPAGKHLARVSRDPAASCD